MGGGGVFHYQEPGNENTRSLSSFASRFSFRGRWNWGVGVSVGRYGWAGFGVGEGEIPGGGWGVARERDVGSGD